MKKANSWPIIDAVYIHYKDPNSRYLVEGMVKLESTGEWMVIYSNQFTGERWVRPNDEFMGYVADDNGESIPRFKYF